MFSTQHQHPLTLIPPIRRLLKFVGSSVPFVSLFILLTCFALGPSHFIEKPRETGLDMRRDAVRKPDLEGRA